MKQGNGVGRRTFLKNAALAGGLAARDENATEQKRGTGDERASKSTINYPRVYSGRRLSTVAFPLGGVGTGCISLGGRGQLRDWEIYNRSDKGKMPQYAFASLWVGVGERKPIARILEARFATPYDGSRGLGHMNIPGLPRLESCTFTGEYPVAKIAFQDSVVPVKLSMEAFSPFIPLEADDSGLPVAILRYSLANPTSERVKASVCFSLENPVGGTGHSNKYRKGSAVEGLMLENPFSSPKDPLTGSFALCVSGVGEGKVTYLTGWRAGIRGTGARRFWDDFSSDGELGPEHPVKDAVCSLCLQREIGPRAQADYTFLLAWHFPNRTPEYCGWEAPKGDERTIIGNHYCTRFSDAWQAAEHAASHLPDLETRTKKFVKAMRETTLPGAVRDAAMSNLSTYVSPTCFRTADGEFQGFEGSNDQGGCCMGSCTHVWNYELATPILFPTLSRSLRKTAFALSTDEQGRMDFRHLLPVGKQFYGFAAADGQMGSIIKLYLDWQLSGDTDWLRGLWPMAKKALEFSWVPGGWDGDRDGVMEGAQHNTYDIELYGPNPLCGIWYLGALRAGEEMALAVGDQSSAEEYRSLFSRGSRWIDQNLFNGEYYIQKIQGMPRDRIAKGLLIEGGSSPNPEEPEYQVGEGCMEDQLVGQYLAEIAGLGELVDRKNVRAALASIYKYNYKRSLYNHECTERVYALNDEAALTICAFPRGKRPEIPMKFFSEVMTGFEYSVATLMIYRGMVAEGLELIENIRRRYDGERRNPWDEAECGHHYARAMASWAPVLALSGFHYSGVLKDLTFLPKLGNNPFRSFWCTPAAWGMYFQSDSKQRVRTGVKVLEGQLAVGRLRLPARTVSRNVRISIAGNVVRPKVSRSGDVAILAFEPEIRLDAQSELEIAAEIGSNASKQG